MRQSFLLLLILCAAGTLSQAGKNPIEQLGQAHHKLIPSLAVSPDGRIVASGSADKTIKLWSVADGSLTKTLTGHDGEVTSVGITPDGRFLISGGKDKTVRVWSLPDGALVKTLTPFSRMVNSIAIAPNGKVFGAVSDDETAAFWTLPDCTPVRIYKDSDRVLNLAFSANGDFAAISALRSDLKALKGGYPIEVVSLADGSVRTLLGEKGWLKGTGHGVNIESIAWGKDGRMFSSDMVGLVNAWSVEGKAQNIVALDMRPRPTWALTLSPDEASLAMIVEGTLELHAPDGKLLATQPAPRHFPQSLAFTPDGKTLISGGSDGRILRWSLPELELQGGFSDPALAKKH